MDPPTNSASLLAQPTRARLFSALQHLKRQASTEELADLLGLHVNGIRRHLELLDEAGLIERAKSRGARGRPRDEWAIAAQAAPDGQRPTAYADLARWLARATPTKARRLREVESAGEQIGRELAPDAAERSLRGFQRILAGFGFQPEVEIEGDGTVRCKLCNCPYRDSVRENQALICTLHKGMTTGLLGEIAPQARVANFEPHDPDQAGCLIEVVGTNWGEGDGDE